MALKIGASLETDLIRLTPATSFTSAQNYLTLNKYAKLIWSAKGFWTVRLTGTQTGLTALKNLTAKTTSGTYGDRIESVHGAFIESGAGNATSNSQLERLELSEIRKYLISGVDGTGPETDSATPFYAAEPLAADTDTTAANHGLWRFLFYPSWSDPGGGGDRHVSLKARLRYAEITSTTYPDWPDEWGDLAVNLAAIEINLLLGHTDMANNIANLIPKGDEQFARGVFEMVKPRSGGGEMVAR